MTPPLWKLALVLAPFIAALLACAAGVARAEREGPDGPALLVTLGVTVATAIFIVTWRDPSVRLETAIIGAGFSSTLVAFMPLLTYYALGRALARRRAVLALVWVALVVPLGIWQFGTVFFAAEIVSCPEDAYECPFLSRFRRKGFGRQIGSECPM